MNSNTNMFIVLFAIWLGWLIMIVQADCPLSNYPRQTTLGHIEAEGSGKGKEVFTYTFEDPFLPGRLEVAIALVSLDMGPNDDEQLKMNVRRLVSTSIDTLSFEVEMPATYWVNVRFGFLASQDYLFEMGSVTLNEFSRGVNQDSYGVYRPIANAKEFTAQPVIKVFVNGLHLTARVLGSEYQQMLSQYNNFKQFSRNQNLITFMQQALQSYRAYALDIESPKLLYNRFLTFSISAKGVLNSLTFSYVIFSNVNFGEKHNQINDDFQILYQSRFEIQPLDNMDMVFSGLKGFELPKQGVFQFSLALDLVGDVAIFSTIVSHDYHPLKFSFIAMEMKADFVCADCQNSPILFEKFCISECPRSYSMVEYRGRKFCEQCSIEEFKVVDLETGECVCAKRHFRNDNNQCQPCRYDCFTCQSTATCATCDNTLLQTGRSMAPDGSCRCPAQLFYDDQESIVCQKCHSSCVTCSGPLAHNCLTCSSDRELDKFNHCVCRNNYVERQDGSCICTPPILVDGQCIRVNVNCTENQIPITEGSVNKCVCEEGYISVLQTCIKCEANERFNQQMVKCECIGETVRNREGKCVACGENQEYSVKTKSCKCSANSFENADGQCVRCGSKQVWTGSSCECTFNYYESSPGICSRCVSQGDGPSCKRVIT